MGPPLGPTLSPKGITCLGMPLLRMPQGHPCGGASKLLAGHAWVGNLQDHQGTRDCSWGQVRVGRGKTA
jgi:hypothetical protein